MRVKILLALFSITIFASGGLATLELGEGDSVEISSGAQITWDSTTEMESDSMNFSDEELRIGREASEDIFYFVSSDSSEVVNLTLFDQDFYSTPDPGDTVLDFEAEASSDSDVSFGFGGFPVVSSGQYRAFSQEVELNRSNTGGIGWDFSDWSTQPFQVEHNRTDLVVEDVFLNESDPVEGQVTDFTANVSNTGAEDLEAEFNFTESSFDGSDFLFEESEVQNSTVESNSSKLVNFSFEADIGRYNYSIEADPENRIDETNESNNFGSLDVNISSYHVFYGESRSVDLLGTSDFALTEWEGDTPTGNLFYSDEQAEYSIRDLWPLNESGDLSEADEALNISANPDSLEWKYDQEGDGFSDKTRCYTIANEEVCDVPVANSTNSSNFVTGIMYDSEDGEGYDGSQDLVFITEAYDEKRQGLYGEYTYEISIPSTLSNQVAEGPFVKYRMEFN